MSCIYCNGNGETALGSYCRCQVGAEMRKRVSRAEAWRSDNLEACRSDIDSRTESIQASGPFPDDDLTHPTMAERLRSIGYREPVTKVQHYCAVCGVDLLAGQPCGAWCHACATQAAKAKLEFKREDWRITWACVVGLVVGIACTLLIVWGFK